MAASEELSGLTASGSLVERVIKFLILVHLPAGYKAPQLRDALITQTQVIPQAWRKTLTWDQGREMSMHEPTAAATGFDVYFCNPHSPWQRGLNENIFWCSMGGAGASSTGDAPAQGRWVTRRTRAEKLSVDMSTAARGGPVCVQNAVSVWPIAARRRFQGRHHGA